MHDSQRSKVYEWERSLETYQKRHTSLDEIRKLADRVCKVYDMKPVNIKDGRRRRSACYESWTHSIKLPQWCRNEAIVLHELAHAVNERKGLSDSHGPGFMRVYLDLLKTFTDEPVRDARKRATAMRIKVATAKRVPTAIPIRKATRIDKINAAIRKLELQIGELENERYRIMHPKMKLAA